MQLLRDVDAFGNCRFDLINPFGWKQPLCMLLLARFQKVPDLCNSRGNVFDLDEPVVNKLTNQMTADTHLDAEVIETIATQGSLSIPLNMNRCILEFHFPIIWIRKD